MNGRKTIFDLIDRGVRTICICLFTGIFFIISLQILFRYLLKSPLVWTEEGARILFIWICLLGGTIAHRNRTHIGIDYFTNKLPDSIRSLLALGLRLLVIIFLISLCVTGFLLAQRSIQLKAVTLPWISWGYIYYSVPVSAFIMLLYSIDEMVS